jgi:hypothetical protein
MSIKTEIKKTEIAKKTLAETAEAFLESKDTFSEIEKTSLSLALLSLEELALKRKERKKFKNSKKNFIDKEIEMLMSSKSTVEQTIIIQKKNLELATERFEFCDDEGRFPHSGLISSINKITNDLHKLQIELGKIEKEIYFITQNKKYETLKFSSSKAIESNNALNLIPLIETSFSALTKNGLTPMSKSKIQSNNNIVINVFGDDNDDD